MYPVVRTIIYNVEALRGFRAKAIFCIFCTKLAQKSCPYPHLLVAKSLQQGHFVT